MALQETKLAAHYIENVRAALRRDGYVFHPGHAVTPHRAGGRGDSCGVGFLASPGVAVSPIMPQGAAWRRLHAMARVHAVQVPPRTGLPAGLRIFSVYVPLQTNPACRDIFFFFASIACCRRFPSLQFQLCGWQRASRHFGLSTLGQPSGVGSTLRQGQVFVWLPGEHPLRLLLVCVPGQVVESATVVEWQEDVVES